MNKEKQIECMFASIILPTKTLGALVENGQIKNPEIIIAIQALQFAVPEIVEKICEMWPAEKVG